MPAERLDRFALAAGLVSVLLAGLALLDDLGGLDVPPALVVALVLAVLGGTALAAGLRRAAARS